MGRHVIGGVCPILLYPPIRNLHIRRKSAQRQKSAHGPRVSLNNSSFLVRDNSMVFGEIIAGSGSFPSFQRYHSRLPCLQPRKSQPPPKAASAAKQPPSSNVSTAASADAAKPWTASTSRRRSQTKTADTRRVCLKRYVSVNGQISVCQLAPDIL